MTDDFVRKIELESLNKTLQISQKSIGDVGCVVWDAAIVLAKYLEIAVHQLNLSLTRKNVIELGAGVGCVGLTAACLGANVVMTDLPEMLPLLECNILANKEIWENCGGKVVAKTLKWSRNLPNDEKLKPDVLLMADCVYYQESIDDLIATLNILCDENTEVIICQEERESEKQKKVWNSFLKSFDKLFTYCNVPEDVQHPQFHSSDICIIRATKRLQKESL